MNERDHFHGANQMVYQTSLIQYSLSSLKLFWF